MSTPEYVPNYAPSVRNLANKLPLDHAKAAALIDTMITPLIERAGMSVKLTKTKTTRTLKITLPHA